MKVLHLTLKKKWFDMVGNGKPEEYRDITEFWIKRLFDTSEGVPKGYTLLDSFQYFPPIEFDQVLFANGGHC